MGHYKDRCPLLINESRERHDSMGRDFKLPMKRNQPTGALRQEIEDELKALRTDKDESKKL